jgi:inorganic phosphate transporter, PiT family
MLIFLLLSAALLVAFSNGANDNFKGFATVWGSNTLSYKQALTLATIATIAGSAASLILANGLIQSFSGKGIIPDVVVNAPNFMLCVACGAGVTVLLATRLGLPISTTHALIGGLIGAGLGHIAADANGSGVNWSALTKTFLAPLIASPIIAALLSAGVYRLFLKPAQQKDCACLVIPTQNEAISIQTQAMPTENASMRTNSMTMDGVLQGRPSLSMPTIVVDTFEHCATQEATVKVSISKTLDYLHIFSAMAICFARGVNDTPKLVALLLGCALFNVQISVLIIAAVMALGGLVFAKKVAQTMSKDVTKLGHRDGFAANMITAFMVIFASKLGFPVSTTQVSVGSIAGIGATTQSLNRKALTNILLSWAATLPLSASIAFVVMKLS